MARVKSRCIMGCPGLKSSYHEKGLLQSKGETIKLLPYYLYDIYFIYKNVAKAITFENITNNLKYK